jgi:hypothetical protein
MIESDKQASAPPNTNTPPREERSSLLDRPTHHAYTTPSRHPSTSSNTGITTTTTPATTTNPPPTPGGIERSAVVLAIFGPSVGPCVGDFSTFYNRVHGRLYAATKALLFYSNLFGFERRMCLQFSDVTHLELFGSTSIRVSMVDCEEYIFKKIAHREVVLELLNQLLVTESSTRSTAALSEGGDATTRKRSLTLPDPINNAIPNTAEDEESNNDHEQDDSTRPHLSSEPPAGEPSSPPPPSRPRSHSVPSFGDSNNRETVPTPGRVLSSLGSQEILLAKKAHSDSEDDLLVSEDGGSITTSTAPPGQKDEMDDGAIKLEWEEAKQLLDESALKVRDLECWHSL